MKPTQSRTELKESTNETVYYRPSVLNERSCGRQSVFDARFPLVYEYQNIACCTFCCGMCCAFCTNCKKNPTEEELDRLLPIRQPNFQAVPDKIKYTWIGHSTAVISIGEQANIMIDPVFAYRSSPFQWVGPARYREPACQISQLPPIHGVFISHDHHDHLDEMTIGELQRLHQPLFCAGIGSKDCFPKDSRLEEFDWTQTKKLNINGHIFEVTFVPVAHRAQRWLCDHNTRLWGGFVIKTPQGKKIFYAGDTAYCEIFKQIGQVFGSIDLAIIPIGAYEPRHLLKYMHVNPEQSVQIHKDIRSKKSVGVHWGTFPLGMEEWLAPRQDLETAKRKERLKEEEFVTLEHGCSLQIDLQ